VGDGEAAVSGAEESEQDNILISSYFLLTDHPIALIGYRNESARIAHQSKNSRSAWPNWGPCIRQYHEHTRVWHAGLANAKDPKSRPHGRIID